MVSRPAPSVIEPSAPVMVRLESIGKKFGTFRALDKVSFHLRKSEVLGLLGPNGAGKTTVMRIIAGYFPPSEGRIWIQNEELSKNPQKMKQKIGYLPESVYLYQDMRVKECVEFVAKVKGVPSKTIGREIEEKLVQCGLWEIRNRLIGHLSKGYRQRLGLAQALIGNPDVLLLDEPTSGLDPKQIIEIRGLIRELSRERTVILSTHILPEVSMVCDRVLIINQGKLVASGTPEELEAGLRTKQEIFLVMGDRHRKDEAIELLEALPEVERVSLLEERGDRIHLSLMIQKTRELRPEITKLFVEHHLPLLEIRSTRLSLEEIFLKIVVTENISAGVSS